MCQIVRCWVSDHRCESVGLDYYYILTIFVSHALLFFIRADVFRCVIFLNFNILLKYHRIMKTNYVVPSIEVIEIQLEDAVLGVSDFIYGDSLGTFDDN